MPRRCVLDSLEFDTLHSRSCFSSTPASRSPSSRDEAKRAAPLESTPKPKPTPTPSITPASSVLERIYSSFNRRLTAEVEVEPPAASGSSWLDVRDVKGLDFCSPALLRPHGLAGVLSISIGLVFTVRSVLGMNHGAPASVVAPYVALYVVSSLVSAAGALGLIKKAPSSTRVFFKALAMLQIGLLYFTYRFATFPELLGLPPAMRAIADVAMASLAVASLLMQIYGVYTNTSDTPRGLRVATFVALAAISALAGYPGQLALFGESWLRKVCQWYPMQLNAFTCVLNSGRRAPACPDAHRLARCQVLRLHPGDVWTQRTYLNYTGRRALALWLSHLLTCSLAHALVRSPGDCLLGDPAPPEIDLHAGVCRHHPRLCVRHVDPDRTVSGVSHPLRVHPEALDI